VATDEIPFDVQRFLYERIATYEQLEVLVRLAESESVADVRTIASTLGVPEDAALEAADALVRVDLVAMIGRDSIYQYNPATPELDTVAKHVVALYRSNRFAVVKAMTTNSLQRLRGSTLHTFAECFLIGGPKKGG
jgi:hypothetical protein